MSPDAASWPTWVVSVDDVRPGLPEAPPTEEEEIRAVLEMQADEGMSALRERWAAHPSTSWTELTVDLIDHYVGTLPRNRVATPARASRSAMLVHLAVHDAMAAARRLKSEAARARPYTLHPDIERRAEYAHESGYPSEHAAAAGAAATVLAYVFPDESAEDFEDFAREAALARVWGGVALPSDVQAGLDLGRMVGAIVVEHARSDGSEAEWEGTLPTGEGAWEPTPPRLTEQPYDPLAGSWRPWFMDDPSELRPPPPPDVRGGEFEAALAELREMSPRLTETEVEAALYWGTSAPSMRWHLYAEDEIRAHGLDALEAAYVHALLSAAMYDAYVSCWEAKYHYWLLRPITADPELSVLIPTPPFPAYPFGHSTISAAAAGVLAALFPHTAERNLDRAKTASESRIWAGIHFRFDAEAGAKQGEDVARLALERATRDGVFR